MTYGGQHLTLREAAALCLGWVLIGGYAVLLVCLAWLIAAGAS